MNIHVYLYTYIYPYLHVCASIYTCMYLCIYIHEAIPHSPNWIYVYTHMDTAFSKVTSILILCGKLSSEQTFENCVPARIHRVIGPPDRNFQAPAL